MASWMVSDAMTEGGSSWVQGTPFAMPGYSRTMPAEKHTVLSLMHCSKLIRALEARNADLKLCDLCECLAVASLPSLTQTLTHFFADHRMLRKHTAKERKLELL